MLAALSKSGSRGVMLMRKVGVGIEKHRGVAGH
jgi:hypothetical protein